MEQRGTVCLSISKIYAGSIPVFQLSNVSKLSHVYTNASDTAIAAVITQGSREDSRSLAYASRNLSADERISKIAEGQFLAVVFAFKTGLTLPNRPLRIAFGK